MNRQQVLYLWLAEGALDTGTIAWAFTTVLRAKAQPCQIVSRLIKTVLLLSKMVGLLQSPAPYMIQPGAEHGASYLPNEFVFVRSIEF